MNVQRLTQQMAYNAERICALVQGVSLEQAQWRSQPESWSILEVVNHLYDEEREDFRVRLDIILNHPDRNWPSIDPQGWVIKRKYNERDLNESLAKFLGERKASLQWLEALSSPNWEASYDAPFGTIRAGDMLASWVAHDLLHMRQLLELHWAHTVRVVRPYHVNYAGPW